MNEKVRARLALLGTMSDLHCEPVAYDLTRLAAIVAEVAPDLLCAEITRGMWEGGDLSAAAVEVREALAPVVAASDVVLVPVAPSAARFKDFAPENGWRAEMVRTFDRLLRWGQRRAGTPEAINGSLFGAFCHTVCHLTEWSWSAAERAAWNEQNEAIMANIMQAVGRDPGRRVLVAVQCQRLHKLEPLLRPYKDEVTLVPYPSL
jgi:hypothetical protein